MFCTALVIAVRHSRITAISSIPARKNGFEKPCFTSAGGAAAGAEGNVSVTLSCVRQYFPRSAASAPQDRCKTRPFICTRGAVPGYPFTERVPPCPDPAGGVACPGEPPGIAIEAPNTNVIAAALAFMPSSSRVSHRSEAGIGSALKNHRRGKAPLFVTLHKLPQPPQSRIPLGRHHLQITPHLALPAADRMRTGSRAPPAHTARSPRAPAREDAS